MPRHYGSAILCQLWAGQGSLTADSCLSTLTIIIMTMATLPQVSEQLLHGQWLIFCSDR
jgi:hypothetical protein